MELRLFLCFFKIKASTLFIINCILDIIMSGTQLGFSVFGLLQNNDKLNHVMIYSLGITTGGAWLLSILHSLITYYCFGSFGSMTNVNYLYSRLVYFLLFGITLWLVLLILQYPKYIALLVCLPILLLIDWSRQLMNEAKRQFVMQINGLKDDVELESSETERTTPMVENKEKTQNLKEDVESVN